MTTAGRVGVCGSVNMDVFGYAPRLPAPGETVLGHRLAYAPGGKGANQAVAARRMGAEVRFAGACGRDTFGDQVVAALDGGRHRRDRAARASRPRPASR